MGTDGLARGGTAAGGGGPPSGGGGGCIALSATPASATEARSVDGDKGDGTLPEGKGGRGDEGGDGKGVAEAEGDVEEGMRLDERRLVDSLDSGQLRPRRREHDGMNGPRRRVRKRLRLDIRDGRARSGRADAQRAGTKRSTPTPADQRMLRTGTPATSRVWRSRRVMRMTMKSGMNEAPPLRNRDVSAKGCEREGRRTA